MKNSIKIIWALLILTTTNNYAQRIRPNDSLLVNLSNKIRVSINSKLQNIKLDTINFVGVYMFKWELAKDNSISNFYCSKGTPETLSFIIKNSLVDAMKTNQINIHNRMFLLPVIIDYEGNSRRSLSKEITNADILKLMIFDDTPKEKESSSFIYSGIPLDCILFPTFFYQTPHYNSSPFYKLKKK